MSSAAATTGTEGDFGAIDEVKSFHHEGDGEENLSSLSELHDLKQDLEHEADTDKAKQPSTPKVTSTATTFAQNGTTTVPLPMFPKMAQPVQFMFPGIPGLVPNGTFPSTATIATSVPGAIKMEFPQNGTTVSGAPGMVLPSYHTNLAMHAYPYMLAAGQYMMPQLLPVAGAGTNGCSPNVIMSQQGIIQQPAKEKKPHIKKPLNAFMLFMKEKRQEVIKECTLKESAAINQILGKMWHQLEKSEQAKYYEMARQERAKHMQMYPGWSARDNYALHKKRKRRKTPKEEEELPPKTFSATPTLVTPSITTSITSEEVLDPNGKKCRARFGMEQKHMWCEPCKRKKRCIKFSDGDDDGEGSLSSPTATGALEGVSTSITMDTNADENSVFNEAWEPLTSSSGSSHEVSVVNSVVEINCRSSSDGEAERPPSMVFATDSGE